MTAPHSPASRIRRQKGWLVTPTQNPHGKTLKVRLSRAPIVKQEGRELILADVSPERQPRSIRRLLAKREKRFNDVPRFGKWLVPAGGLVMTTASMMADRAFSRGISAAALGMFFGAMFSSLMTVAAHDGSIRKQTHRVGQTAARVAQFKPLRDFFRQWKYVYVDKEGNLAGSNWNIPMTLRHTRLETRKILTGAYLREAANADPALLPTYFKGNKLKELSLMGRTTPKNPKHPTMLEDLVRMGSILGNDAFWKSANRKLIPEQTKVDIEKMHARIGFHLSELSNAPTMKRFVRGWKYLYLVNGERFVGSNVLLPSTRKHMRFSCKDIQNKAWEQVGDRIQRKRK